MTEEYKSPYRLPSGEFTEDGDAYIEAYQTIAKAVLENFKGYEWVGITHDHGLEFASREYYNNGKFQFVHHFKLPLAACYSLIYNRTPERTKRFDLYPPE